MPKSMQKKMKNHNPAIQKKQILNLFPYSFFFSLTVFFPDFRL